MDSYLKVTRARVSYVAVRVTADILEDLANPDRFDALLQSPQPVAGLALTLPYLDGTTLLKPDQMFWSKITNRATLGQSGNGPSPGPSNLRRNGLPLRHRAVPTDPHPKAPSAPRPRLEIFLMSYGCVAVATLDVVCEPPLDLKDLAKSVSALDASPVASKVGTQVVQAEFATLADRAADTAVDLLSGPGETWSSLAYPIVSIISAIGDPQLNAMPATGGPIHREMHAVARGGAALPAPGSAFLPYWSGVEDFSWAESELVYILDVGTAQLRQSAALQLPQPPAWTTSDHHRLLTLSRVHVAADLCLLEAAEYAGSQRLDTWANLAARRLSRLYGPNPPSYDFWGLACRRFTLTDPMARQRIKARTGEDPHGKKWPAYPA